MGTSELGNREGNCAFWRPCESFETDFSARFGVGWSSAANDKRLYAGVERLRLSCHGHCLLSIRETHGIANRSALSERVAQGNLSQFNGLDFYCRDSEARYSIQLSYGRWCSLSPTRHLSCVTVFSQCGSCSQTSARSGPHPEKLSFGWTKFLGGRSVNSSRKNELVELSAETGSCAGYSYAYRRT